MLLNTTGMKTLLAFERQLDDLCAVTRGTLRSSAHLEAIREVITRARSEVGVASGYTDERLVSRCADRFLRILAAADHELDAHDIARLEQYVQRCLQEPW